MCNVFPGIINQINSEISFHRCIGFVFRYHADGKGRGVGFIIKCGGGLEGAIGLEGKKGIIPVPCPAYEVVGQRRVGIWISGVELAHYGADWLILGEGEGCGRVEVGGGGVLLA